MSNVPAGTVTSTMIADGTIVNADINASAAIAGSKVAPSFVSDVEVLASNNATTRSVLMGPSDYATSGKYLAVQWSHALQAGVYYTQGAFPHTFFTNNVERMRLDSSGRLGLGTSAPQAELNVSKTGGAATVYIESDAGNNATTSILRFGGASARSASIQGFRGASSNVHSLDFYTYNSADAFGMRLTPTGLGIGVTSPSYLLDVNGIARISSYLITPQVDVATNTGIYSQSANTLQFQTGNLERARIDSSGRLLVGTSTSQGSYNLQCFGTGVWGQGAYVNGSDASIKQNVSDLPPSLEVVKNLRPVTFEYKPEYSQDQTVQAGFIAQELQEAMEGQDYLDGIVQQGTNHLNVAYQSIIPVLTKALQEAVAKIETLEAKVAALEAV
jgi:hypothetical protein